MGSDMEFAGNKRRPDARRASSYCTLSAISYRACRARPASSCPFPSPRRHLDPADLVVTGGRWLDETRQGSLALVPTARIETFGSVSLPPPRHT